MTTKEINFMFRDEKGNDLKGGTLIIRQGMNWLELEKELAKFLEQFTSKSETIAAAILCNNWMKKKEFPNGMHFFIDWDNDFSWTHGFLFRVKDPAPLTKIFEGTPPTKEEAPGGYVTSACGTKFQRAEAFMVTGGGLVGIVVKPDTVDWGTTITRTEPVPKS